MNSKTVKKINMAADKGNISIFALVSVIAFSLLFLLLIDCCRIYVARSVSKKAADAVALAVAQDLLFFENEKVLSTAQAIADANSCLLKEVAVTYDGVMVEVQKDIDFTLLKLIGRDSCTVTSISETEVIYPWDEALGLCRSCTFDWTK